MASNPRTGLFIGTTPLFDVGDLQDAEQTKELIIRLTQKINEMIIALNLKDTGYYVLNEFLNSQVFFPNPLLTDTTPQSPYFRQVYRLVVNFGALPNAGLKSVPHGLVPTALWSFTRIYGAATDPIGLNYIPLPYASPVLANNIELNVDAVNVNIITGSDRTNFTTTYVILEYIKS
ncbi:hypothetical protein UFOVP97_27 [uncultured Caudovirales phage]|uniref:Uncharacterized protein n=1 Tax=uncultured Caudovirales phage TaxID=2100421 RepID=A0A6J5L055_9CAUD|nr:hypothetical protein UFOVP97_27 [uncultured Caudovirales phage]CAB4134334.1 hypothetical protein UFOVP268_45 [uncultured Caudovirales phage]